jgi:hypothetical protein
VRPLRAWLFSVPLIAAGSLVAHSLAYRLAFPEEHGHDAPYGRSGLAYLVVFPPDHVRDAVYGHSGHPYLRLAPYVSAVCVALVLAAVLAHAVRPALTRTASQIALWPFVFLPLGLFLVQEHAARFLGTGSFPAGAMLEKPCLLGVALQIPLGLIAYWVARALVRLSEELGRLLVGAAVRTARLRVAYGTRVRHPSVPPARISILALNRAGRAPPVSA